MPLSWVFVIILVNLFFGLLAYHIVVRREDRVAQESGPDSVETKKTVETLHQLTCEVTQRVEKNLERLDGFARGLAAAIDSPHSGEDVNRMLPGTLAEQREFAGFLRHSIEEYEDCDSRLGVALCGSGSRGTGTVSDTVDAADLKDVFREILEAAHSNEQRSELRNPCAFPMLFLALNDLKEPIGDVFQAVARDLSAGGMSFLHTQPLRSPYLAAVIFPPNRNEICIVLERRHTSRAGKMYLTGGEFVSRLADGSAKTKLQTSEEYERGGVPSDDE